MTRIRQARETVCVVVESRMGHGKITLQAANGDSIRTVLAKAGFQVGDRIRLVPLEAGPDGPSAGEERASGEFRPLRSPGSSGQ